MTPNLTFRSQALNDGVSAHLQVEGSLVPDNATECRMHAADEAASISLRGSLLFDRDGAELFRFRKSFLIQIYSNEKDDRGRSAPMICWGPIQGGNLQASGLRALEGFHSFAARIGRTVNLEHVKLIEEELLRRARRRRKLVAAAVAVTAAAVVSYGIATQRSPKNDEQASVHSE
jgi:hypothetical protein